MPRGLGPLLAHELARHRCPLVTGARDGAELTGGRWHALRRGGQLLRQDGGLAGGGHPAGPRPSYFFAAAGLAEGPSSLAARLRDFLAVFSCAFMASSSRSSRSRSSRAALTALLCFFKLARSCFSVFAAWPRACWARSRDFPAGVAVVCSARGRPAAARDLVVLLRADDVAVVCSARGRPAAARDLVVLPRADDAAAGAARAPLALARFRVGRTGRMRSSCGATSGEPEVIAEPPCFFRCSNHRLRLGGQR
jgi:hypothetical protein